MRTQKEVALELKSVKSEMKARRIRQVSCFNGGLSNDERQFNSRLFNLKTELLTIKAVEQAKTV